MITVDLKHILNTQGIELYIYDIYDIYQLHMKFFIRKCNMI